MTPTSDQVTQWRSDAPRPRDGGVAAETYIAEQAYRQGADDELEACIQWFLGRNWEWTSAQLRAARRPKPPSLKQQALADLDLLESTTEHLNSLYASGSIRRALESLPDD